MYIQSYKYYVGERVNDRVVIDIDRDSYTNVLARRLKPWIDTLVVGSKVALLYAAGPAIHHSDSRNVGNTARDGVVAVKSQIGYVVYDIARMCKFEIDFISSNTNTCASSMYSLYEASMLLSNCYTDVIIISSDLVDEAQELLFKQLGIDLLCGDGLVGMHLSHTKSNIEVSQVVWKWNKDSSPMSVSKEGYLKVLSELDTSDIDIVKMHGSGTERNTSEELSAIKRAIGYVRCKEYKSIIGHTQGASTAIEIGMLCDEEWSKAIVLASGLGGFYGGCSLRRHDGDSKD